MASRSAPEHRRGQLSFRMQRPLRLLAAFGVLSDLIDRQTLRLQCFEQQAV
jgi:hypothetical protein